MAELDFNAEEHQPHYGFEPIPPGDYTASITSSEVKQTKNGQGTYLELVWQVLEGERKADRLWQRVMLTHPSEKCVDVGRGKLSALCHAVGVLQLNDSSQLHDIPTTIRVIVKEEKGYEPSNEITSFPGVKSKNDDHDL